MWYLVKMNSQAVKHQRQTACFILVPQKQSAQVGQWSPLTHPEEDQKDRACGVEERVHISLPHPSESLEVDTGGL